MRYFSRIGAPPEGDGETEGGLDLSSASATLREEWRELSGRRTATPPVKEISHRMGTSLHAISCLVRRAERAIYSDPEAGARHAAETLQSVQRAIASIAMVQRILYEVTPAPEAFGELVDQVGTHLKAIYDRPAIAVTMERTADMPRALVQTIALVACELITNALRHGFDDGESGTVRVSLEEIAPQGLRLTVSDSGKGIARDAPEPSAGQGLALVHEIVGDACGRIVEHRPDTGAVWEVEFPVR